MQRKNEGRCLVGYLHSQRLAFVPSLVPYSVSLGLGGQRGYRGQQTISRFAIAMIACHPSGRLQRSCASRQGATVRIARKRDRTTWAAHTVLARAMRRCARDAGRRIGDDPKLGTTPLLCKLVSDVVDQNNSQAEPQAKQSMCLRRVAVDATPCGGWTASTQEELPGSDGRRASWLPPQSGSDN